MLSALAREFPEIHGFSLFDAEGNLRISTYARLDGITIAGLEHFQSIKLNPDRKLRFTETLKAITNDRMVVVAYRALFDRDDNFAGVIGISINLDHYASIFSKMLVGDHGMISIRRSDDSKLVVRWPIVAEKANNLATGIPPFQNIQAGETAGVVRYIGKTDGVDRIFAFHKIGNYPFFVLVGRAVEEQFSTWRTTAYLSSLLVLVALALLGWVLHRLKAKQYQLQQSEASLRRENEKYLALLHNASDGIHILDDDGNVIEASDSFCAMLGYAREEMIGLNVREWDASYTEDERKLLLSQQLERSQRSEFETLHRRKDGSIFPVQVSGYPLKLEGRPVLFNSSHDISARKRMEDYLRDSEKRLRAIIDGAMEGILLADRATKRFVKANPAMCAMLGYNNEEILSLSVTDIHPSADLPYVLEQFERQACHEIVLFENAPMLRKDGCVFFADISSSTLTIDGREYLAGFFRDVSERKAALIALDEERKVRETLMESIPGVFYAMNSSGIFTFWNRSFEQVTGRTPEELGQLNAIDLFEGVDRTHVAERINQVFEQGSSTAEALLVAKDGRRTPYHFTGRRIEMQGQPILVGAGIDISTLKQAEETLRHFNAELEARVTQKTNALQEAHKQLLDTQFAMDSVGIGISWADFETGRFIYANRYCAEFLGYTLDEYLQLQVMEIDPNFPREAYDQIKEHIKQEKRVQFETAQKSKDGRLLPVEMTIYYHPGGEGERPKFIAFMSDIAQRKEAAQALQQAKEAADAANQAKSAFLANMSHEIRTPLNAILGLNHLMRDDSLTAKQVERLEKMEIAGRHLLSIINDILDLSKIEAGRLELETDNFHLSAVLDNVASMIRDSASEKGLTLEIDPDGVPLWLRGDAIRLRQSLLNFASNAVKFTDQGKISLRALLLEDDANGLLCRFEVADSGIGLTPEQLDRLFQNFQQADESTARKYGGTGLGLALTKRLVELMGGKVGADSTAGDGSTFWFTVPLQRGHGPMPQQAVRGAAQSSEARLLQEHRGARILLAEDNPINTEVVLELMHAAGMDVTVAENGSAAVEQVRQQHFDLILMDMQMPVMDGPEATRTILAMPERAAIPILALTANVFAEDRRACIEAGMVDMLTKPVDPATLYAALLKWLPQHAVVADNPPPLVPPPAAPAASDTEIIERLRGLRGIDVDHGLKLLHGKTGRYINLLRNFLKSQGEDWTKLEQCLATGDCAEAKRQSHSLKGAAGTLALTELAMLATHLDTLLGDSGGAMAHFETIRALLDEIRSEMKILGNALSV